MTAIELAGLILLVAACCALLLLLWGAEKRSIIREEMNAWWAVGKQTKLMNGGPGGR